MTLHSTSANTKIPTTYVTIPIHFTVHKVAYAYHSTPTSNTRYG